MKPVPGVVVPSHTRRFSKADLVAYAGATWDWHQMHYDRDFATSRNLPGPVVDGQVFGALVVQQLQDWLGPFCFVRSLAFTYRALVFAGETVRCEAEVVDAADGSVTVRGRVVVIDADGRAVRIAVDAVTAEVLFGAADGAGGAG